MSFAPLDPGAVFARRYRVERRIPGGGMSAVYEVLDLNTDRARALKVMLPELAQNPALLRRFLDEPRRTAKLRSQHIVDVTDAGVDETTGLPFLVMELLHGEELGVRLRRLGSLTPEEVLVFITQTALALDKVHAISVVHRDLKPENLFVEVRDDGSPCIKVLDFGIAKVLKDGSAGNRTETIGTPVYMAPEQFSGETPSASTDIYALGLVAYTLLVGTPYWYEEAVRDQSAIAFALIVSNAPVEPPGVRARRRGKALPLAFDAWFATATHRDPARRFQRASEAALALRRALEGWHPIAGATIVPLEPSGLRTTTMPFSGASTLLPPQPRRRALLIIAGSVGIAAVAIPFTVRLVRDKPNGLDQPESASTFTSAEPQGSTPSLTTSTASTAPPSSGAPPPLNSGAPSARPSTGPSPVPPVKTSVLPVPPPPSMVLPAASRVPPLAPAPPPKTRCYIHPYSGRIRPVVPAEPAPPAATFPCLPVGSSWKRL